MFIMCKAVLIYTHNLILYSHRLFVVGAHLALFYGWGDPGMELLGKCPESTKVMGSRAAGHTQATYTLELAVHGKLYLTLLFMTVFICIVFFSLR